MVGPIDRRFARAESSCRVAGWRRDRQDGKVIHDRIGKGEADIAVEITDAVARAAPHQRSSCSRRTHEVQRNAGIHTEIPVEVISHRAIEPCDAAQPARSARQAFVESETGPVTFGILSECNGTAKYQNVETT